MPYIAQDRRDKLHLVGAEPPADAGELNFCITKMLIRYFQQNTAGNYAGINEIMGAVECAKLEFYRRVAAPYEDGKISQNGDVY